MDECGSFDFTIERLRQLQVDLNEQIAALGGNELLERIVSMLCKDILQPFDSAEAKTNTAAPR